MRLFVAAALAISAVLTASHASATCAVIGDSIAEDLRGFFSECHVNVKIGIGTAAIAKRPWMMTLVPSIHTLSRNAQSKA